MSPKLLGVFFLTRGGTRSTWAGARIAAEIPPKLCLRCVRFAGALPEVRLPFSAGATFFDMAGSQDRDLERIGIRRVEVTGESERW